MFAPYYQVQAERYAQLAAAVIVGYEYILQFRKEVNYFWWQRWTLGKSLFMWNRYFSLGFTISTAYMFMNDDSSEEFCMKFFAWQNAGIAVQYVTTQVILQLRLYVMYNKSKLFLAFLVCLTTAEIVVLICMFSIPREGLVGTNSPLPGVFICADADPPHEHWIVFVPLTTLIVETIFLTLALLKSWGHYKSHSRGQILPWLTSQSVFYFFGIFWTHLLNVIIWMINIITLNELITGFSVAIPAVLANRLLLSIRERTTSVNSTIGTVEPQSALTWRAPAGRGNSMLDTGGIGEETMRRGSDVVVHLHHDPEASTSYALEDLQRTPLSHEQTKP